MKKSLTYLLCIFLFVPSVAQTDTILLDDVTVSVTPFAQRLSEATGSLSILRIDAELAAHSINIADQLNTLPGIYMPAGTNTTNRLTIRGVGSRSPYSSNRIKAYYEEIPLTNGDGISTIEDMDLNGISRVEVLKGPASAMYGAGLGGIVKLKALYPAETGLSLKLSSATASYHSWKNAIGIGWKSQNTAVMAGYSRATSHGFRENNNYRRDHFFLHGKKFYGKNSLSLHFLATDLYAEIPSSLGATDFLNSPEKAAANWLAVKGYEEYAKINAGISWETKLSDRLSKQLVFFTSWQNPYESRPFNILDDASTTLGVREVLSYNKKNLKIQSGIELFTESYDWQIFETNQGAQGELQLNNTEKRSYGNIFAHLNWKPLPRVIIEGGVNLNVIQYTLETLFNIDNINQSGKYSYDPVVSPRLGLNYNLSPGQSFHLSAGHGFSAPSLEETLLPEGLINPALKPETGWNFDAGIRGWLADKRWYYDLGAYSIFMRNMLVTKRISEDTFTGINAGAASLSGLEFFNRIILNESENNSFFQNELHLSLFLNKNRFTEFTDDGVDLSAKNLPGIPASMIYGQLLSSFKEKLEFKAGLRYSGSQYMNDINTELYEGEILADCRLSYLLASKNFPYQIRLSAGVANIFNAHYASMILINAPSFGASEPRYFYPGMPRNFIFSLSLQR